MPWKFIKMFNYIATFYTHYGAIKFYNTCIKNNVTAKQMPAPRVLSASCGTCVAFEAPTADIFAYAEDAEACYLCDADGYTKLTSAD